MTLPPNVAACIARLEAAGFPCYAVGGCVRDDLLGLTPRDYDLTTAASGAQMREIFRDFPLVLAGEKHGTVGVVMERELVEITTFRAEGGYTDGRHPGWVKSVDSIEADLARRDFTINAMAYSPTRGFADPFGGRADLRARTLRAVGDPETRFREDALRILRGVRFCARFALTPEEATLGAMLRLAGAMELLSRERVFSELNGILLAADDELLLRFAPILAQVLPELAPTIGYEQGTPWHRFDLYTHIAKTVGGVRAESVLRWAALLHDCGKPACRTTDERGVSHYYGHAEQSAALADAALARLRAPTALREEASLLIARHMSPLPPQKKALRRQLSRFGVEFVDKQWALQKADTIATGQPVDWEYFRQVDALLALCAQEDACLTVRDLAVDGRDLLARGLRGRAVGEALRALLDAVLDERVENEKSALLRYLEEEKQ
ncbi:MAG: CCA tRNA nucleotidyltransferase [Firmicutes bacterium]|nr:CCA tRNA nucleotidyltransferase [Bacillota bacterium]